MLGYVKTASGQWTTPEAEKTAARTINFQHPKLGWPAGSLLEHRNAPLRDPDESFQAEGLEAGQQLENLHALWRQIFFRYWYQARPSPPAWPGGNEPLARPRPRMNVVLFKDRPQYAAYVAAVHPKAATTLGIYVDKLQNDLLLRRRYVGLSDLVSRSGPPAFSRRRDRYRRRAGPGAATSGRSKGRRSIWSRWPITAATGPSAAARLTDCNSLATGCCPAIWPAAGAAGSHVAGRRSKQRRYRAPLYASPPAIHHFLIDGERGKYREAFVDLLSAIYRGKDTAETLSRNSRAIAAAARRAVSRVPECDRRRPGGHSRCRPGFATCRSAAARSPTRGSPVCPAAKISNGSTCR